MKLQTKRKGLTLIEICLIVVILAIVGAVIVPAFSDFLQRARGDADLKNAKVIYTSGLLAASTTGDIDAFLKDLPIPQGKPGAFQVWDNDGVVEVYIVGNSGSPNYEYSPETNTFLPDTEIPTSSGDVVNLTP
jgi:type II secretory pathway pseudopilin PulG